MVREVVANDNKQKNSGKAFSSESLQRIDDVVGEAETRIDVADTELNRVLGGGIVHGSLVLLSGEPGIGKSTLALQLLLQTKAKSLYVSGEESPSQIALRANRMDGSNEELRLLAATDVQTVLDAIESYDPELVLIDSIQTLYASHLDAAPGSVVQIRETCAALMREAKTSNRSILIIGHITKDGFIAGPKLLEHMVDVVLYFEGEQHNLYRVLRSSKNRFGSTLEIGIYEMTSSGLQAVLNPSEALLDQHGKTLSGVSIAASLEGIRPILLEIQALVSPSQYGTPQRTATGFDSKRLSMLVAVLEKRCGLRFGNHDIFLNIAGGIRTHDPSVDLAVLAALSSSLLDQALPALSVFAGEVGLSGDIKKIQLPLKRIVESERLGFTSFFTAQHSSDQESKMTIHALNDVGELIRKLFTSG